MLATNPLTPFHVGCQFQFRRLLCGYQLNPQVMYLQNDSGVRGHFLAPGKCGTGGPFGSTWRPTETQLTPVHSGFVSINHHCQGAFDIPAAPCPPSPPSYTPLSGTGRRGSCIRRIGTYFNGNMFFSSLILHKMHRKCTLQRSLFSF